jgi:hypothetical protein
MRIRLAHDRDAARIGEIVADAYGVYVERIGRRPRALLAFAETHALKSATRTLRLYTNAAMTENLELYPRLGYQETARRTENGFERVFFTKQLAQGDARTTAARIAGLPRSSNSDRPPSYP